MAESLEKRMTDVEYIIAHLPDDLNARFAGVDVKFASIRETQLLHTQRFSTLERKIEEWMGRLETRIGGLETSMDRLETRMDSHESRMDRLESKVDGLDARVGRLERNVEAVDGKLDLILTRLPAA